jgi:methylmalonyl-CoA mutase N-terminal domain/subunit
MKRVESGEEVVVGVNRFEAGDEPAPPAFEIHPETERRAVERVRAHRARRDGKASAAALAALASATAGDENLVPKVLACVEAGATLGEVMQAFETRWGRAPGT